ncbi:MAG: tetratricopeptide repeat protein [Paraprevotella sp.]|nr:tetratricopeptide repeat protein [Paraprevotella sp.]
MGFLKALFGGQEESAEEKEQKQQTRNFNILKYDGIKALKMQQPEYAVRCLEEALRLQADDEAETCLAQAYMASGRTEEARDTLTRLAERMPDRTTLWLALAQVEMQLNAYEEAVLACARALEADAACAEAHFLSGKAHAAMAHPIEAVAALTQALQCDRDMEVAYRERAGVLKDMYQFAEAEQDADYLLEHFGENEDNLMLKGNLLQSQGRTEEALTYYNKVKDVNPFHQEAYIALSETYATNRQADRSLEVLEEGIELIADFAAAYKERGRIRLMLNDKEGAMDDLKRALELSPEEGKTLDGNYSNVEQEMNELYKSRNPYGF